MKTRKAKQKMGTRLFNNARSGKPRVPGTGYGTRERALKTIRKLRGKPATLKKQIITTMYYRAKHHKYQTQGMRNAMKVYRPYLKGGQRISPDGWKSRSRPAYVEEWESRSFPLPADG
jgi:hypothetical protein